MILSDFEIRVLCEGGMVTPFDPSLVNPASLDVRLGNSLLIESAQSPELVPYPFHRHSRENPYPMTPAQFALSATLETFFIPRHLTAQFMLKSSRGREGVDCVGWRMMDLAGLTHAFSGFCDPGWTGSKLTLELKNNRQLHPVYIWPGMRIGQFEFSRMSQEPEHGYDEIGHYNNDLTVTASKGYFQ